MGQAVAANTGGAVFPLTVHHSRLPHAEEQKMNETTVQITLITLAIITQAIVLLQAACILLL